MLMLAASASGVAGCGADHGVAQAPTPTATDANPTRAVSSSAAVAAAHTAGPAPGAVAVAYTRALFGGHFATAKRYLEPGSRNALEVVARGLGAGSVRARHLAAGSTTMHGSAATVVLTGTLCSTHTDARGAADCVTNRDPRATNPIFIVELEQTPAGRWQVAYRMPQ